MITPTFAQPSENSSSWHLGDQTCNSPPNNYPHKSSIPQQRAVKQLIRYLKRTQHTCLRLEPSGMVHNGLLEPVGRSDSDWARCSATRQSVTGYHCDVQNVTTCNRSLKQTAISLSSCEAEFYAATACAGELLGHPDLPHLDCPQITRQLIPTHLGGTRAGPRVGRKSFFECRVRKTFFEWKSGSRCTRCTRCTLYTAHYTLRTPHHTPPTLHITHNTPHTTHTTHSHHTLHTPRSTFHIHIPQTTFYTQKSTGYIQHATFFVLHSTF